MQVMGAWKFVRSLPASLSLFLRFFLSSSLLRFCAPRTLLPETIIQYKKSNKVC